MYIDIAKVAIFLAKFGLEIKFLFFKKPPFKGFDMRLPVAMIIKRIEK